MTDYLKIIPQVMEYEWGNKTYIPQLINKEVDGKPKAELWIGTHPGAPSHLENGELLSKFFEENEEFLGKKHLDRYGNVLPLLFKILAIDKPLSIQCHPSKKIAEEGWKNEKEYRKTHERSLWNYKDDNQKAELLYALTEVSAMCGFLPYSQIVENLKTIIPNNYNKYFEKLESSKISDDEKTKTIFENLYRMDRSELKILIDEMIESLNALDIKKSSFLSKEEITLKSYKEFPNDPGLFCPFLLNVLHLNKGEAIYLEPRILHAYVYGNGVEIMCSSDNVLRGGLTNKKMDVDELMKVMIVRREDAKVASSHLDDYNRLVLETPCPDFELKVIENNICSIHTEYVEFLLFTGEAKLQFSDEELSVNKGDVYLLRSNIEYSVSTTNPVFCATIGQK